MTICEKRVYKIYRRLNSTAYKQTKGEKKITDHEKRNTVMAFIEIDGQKKIYSDITGQIGQDRFIKDESPIQYRKPIVFKSQEEIAAAQKLRKEKKKAYRESQRQKGIESYQRWKQKQDNQVQSTRQRNQQEIDNYNRKNRLPIDPDTLSWLRLMGYDI